MKNTLTGETLHEASCKHAEIPKPTSIPEKLWSTPQEHAEENNARWNKALAHELHKAQGGLSCALSKRER